MLPEWAFSCPHAKDVVAGVYICKIRTERDKKDNTFDIGKFCDAMVCPLNPKLIDGNWKFDSYQSTLNKFT